MRISTEPTPVGGRPIAVMQGCSDPRSRPNVSCNRIASAMFLPRRRRVAVFRARSATSELVVERDRKVARRALDRTIRHRVQVLLVEQVLDIEPQRCLVGHIVGCKGVGDLGKRAPSRSIAPIPPIKLKYQPNRYMLPCPLEGSAAYAPTGSQVRGLRPPSEPVPISVNR